MGFQSDEILKTKVGSACRGVDEGIGGREVSPAGREKAQATRLVPVIDTLLSPLPAVSGQLQRLLKEWMERMGYTETSCRIVPIKRI